MIKLTICRRLCLSNRDIVTENIILDEEGVLNQALVLIDGKKSFIDDEGNQSC